MGIAKIAELSTEIARMNYRFFFFMLCLPALARGDQDQICDIFPYQERETVVVEYELCGDPSDVVFDYSLDDGHSWNQAKGARGGIGPAIEPGHREILWRVLEDHPEGLDSEVVVRVRATASSAAFLSESEATSGLDAMLQQGKLAPEQAQRDAARAVAEDALRNAIETANYLSEANLLARNGKILEKMVEGLGAGYQRKLTILNSEVSEKKAYAREQFSAYIKSVAKLGGYDDEYIVSALTDIEGSAKTTGKSAQTAYAILIRHMQQYQSNRRTDEEGWWHDFEEISVSPQVIIYQ